MPFALVTIGFFLIILGFQNTYKQAAVLISNDFTGENNFIYWLASLGIVGSLGYIESLEKFSRYGLTLIILVMILRNRGVFENLQEALSTGTQKPVNIIGGPLPSASGGGTKKKGGLGGIVGKVAGSVASDFILA